MFACKYTTNNAFQLTNLKQTAQVGRKTAKAVTWSSSVYILWHKDCQWLFATFGWPWLDAN